MTLLYILFFAGLITTILCLVAWGGCALIKHLWRRAGSERPLMRIAIIVLGLGMIASPYLAWKVYEYQFTLARLPEPLEVEKIEFQNEEAWGIGPGANETGFIAYRLTPDSAEWVRVRSETLVNDLPGGQDSWKQTPITCMEEPRCRWHGSFEGETGPDGGPSTRAYMGKYGFGIEVDRKWIEAVDDAITAPGSVYRYGRGGSVTIIVPKHGMAFYIYAG